MSKQAKTKRTQIKDLAAGENKLPKQEMELVQGGVTVRGWDPATKRPIQTTNVPSAPKPQTDLGGGVTGAQGS